MKILFLCHRLPYPPDHGGKIRPYNFIRHLGKKHSVTVASLADSEKELKSGSPLNESCEDVIAEVLPSRVRRFQALKALFTSTPSSVAYFWSRDLFKRIKNRLETAEYDVVSRRPRAGSASRMTFRYGAGETCRARGPRARERFAARAGESASRG